MIHTYTWKLCPFSIHYRDRYLKPSPPPYLKIDGTFTLPGPLVLMGTSINLEFVKETIGEFADNATEHSDTEGQMAYSARGWTCFDDNCYYYTNYTNLGNRYHEE